VLRSTSSVCIVILLACAVTFTSTSDTTAAERRVALAIGNSAYQHARELPNPKNDATDMAAVLRNLGFEVTAAYDLDKAGFDGKIRDFATVLAGSDVGVFFFSGHGLQVGGQNYLVPIDAQLRTAAALDVEAVRLDSVYRAMARETKTSILFLDASRDNPLAHTMGGPIRREPAAGELSDATLISFSAQPGGVALEGASRNSPYAAALIKRITVPGEDLSTVLAGVRRDVMAATNNKQIPWEHSSLPGPFYFVQGSGKK